MLTFGDKRFMNTRCIKNDLAEARDQLSVIIATLDKGKEIPEADYVVMLQHAFHHLNIAWNARRSSPASYRNMSMKDFYRWGKFPHGTEWDTMNQTTIKPPVAQGQSGS